MAGRDEYIDHSLDQLAGNTFRLFDPQVLTTASHHLYLAHSALLNLSGNVELGLEFQLLHAVRDALEIAWEYWDGQVWRSFAALDPGCESRTEGLKDATNGLTVSGVIRLKADCAKSDKTTVNGIGGYWIRGRLTQSLPPDSAMPLPAVESIRISNLVHSSIIGRLSGRATALGTSGLTTIAQSVTARARRVSMTQTWLTAKVTNEAQQLLRGAIVTIPPSDVPDVGERTAQALQDGTFKIAIDDVGVFQFDVVYCGIRASTKIDVPSLDATIELALKLSGLALDKAFNDGTKLDTTKPFYPFGQQPQPGTVFYFSSKEIFSKPGARFRIYLPRTSASSDKLGSGTAEGEGSLPRTVIWEYWDGREWAELASASEPGVAGDFTTSEILDSAVPADLVAAAVNQDTDLWMRARLVEGGHRR